MNRPILPEVERLRRGDVDVRLRRAFDPGRRGARGAAARPGLIACETETGRMAKPLNVGLVGGGKGAFIVHAHQKAIHFDGTRRVVAGALYPDPKVALDEAAA
ncbi:MAG: hypothetical protein MUF60_06415, partial [Vicinamibacterales bacterium]|nr:hypothetical protein [Vicinamibacterales bacterium]